MHYLIKKQARNKLYSISILFFQLFFFFLSNKHLLVLVFLVLCFLLFNLQAKCGLMKMYLFHIIGWEWVEDDTKKSYGQTLTACTWLLSTYVIDICRYDICIYWHMYWMCILTYFFNLKCPVCKTGFSTNSTHFLYLSLCAVWSCSDLRPHRRLAISICFVGLLLL